MLCIVTSSSCCSWCLDVYSWFLWLNLQCWSYAKHFSFCPVLDVLLIVFLWLNFQPIIFSYSSLLCSRLCHSTVLEQISVLPFPSFGVDGGGSGFTVWGGNCWRLHRGPKTEAGTEDSKVAECLQCNKGQIHNASWWATDTGHKRADHSGGTDGGGKQTLVRRASSWGDQYIA